MVTRPPKVSFMGKAPLLDIVIGAAIAVAVTVAVIFIVILLN
jgi:uncharacterized RDD family membrane protein YckC